MNLWDNVDLVSKEKGITLSLAAESAGISYDTVRNWRTRHIYPRVDEAKALADAFGVSVDKLFFNTEQRGNSLSLIARLNIAEAKLDAIREILGVKKEDPCS